MTEFLVKDAWGVASSRQCAGFPLNDGVSYYAPLGCSIVKWNITTKDKTMFQAHGDLITVMLQSKNHHLLTVSYTGEVKLWNIDMKMLASFQLPTYDVIYGSWSLDGSLFSICSKGPNQMLLVYDFNSVLDNYKKHTDIKWKWQSIAPQTLPEADDDQEANKKTTKSYDCYNAAIFKENLEVLVIYQSLKTCVLFLFTTDGKVSKQVNISPLGDKENIMLCISDVYKNMIAVGLQRGLFVYYEIDTLKQLAVIQAHGSPQVCLWQDDKFVTVSYITGVITWWDKQGKELQEFSGGPTGSNVQMNLSIKDKNSYWIGGIMSLHYVTLSTQESKVIKSLDISFLSLTGCGLAISDKNLVASGDFTGQLLMWDFSKPLPVVKLNTASPAQIRCLSWYKDFLLIGNLDGDLSFYDAKKKSDITHLYTCFGGITISRLSNMQDKLLVGTTTGLMYIFSITVNSEGVLNCDLLYKYLQHKPKPQPDGSELPMEIWSAVWNLDDSLVATCSEDQTTAVAESDAGKILYVLTGHTTAVTSADWKRLTNDYVVLATCADDRTVRIYDGVNFTLQHVVNTYDLYGWHTLTYLVINEKSDLLIVSTQNGFLVVWDLHSYDCVIKRKLHGGSIEGLALDKTREFMLTTSSDCVVQRFGLDRK